MSDLTSSRTLCAAAVGLSILVYSGLLSGYYTVFIRQSILKLPFPHLWRLVTPFLMTGPGLGIIFDPYFLYTYGKGLETEASRFSQPGDFFTFLVFVCIIIVVGDHLSSIHSKPFPLREPRNICPPSQYLAEAVPGNEEDYPCIVHSPVIRKPYLGAVRNVGLVELVIEKILFRLTMSDWWLCLPT